MKIIATSIVLVAAVYQIAEKLADEVWDIVVRWTACQAPLGNSLSDPPTASARILLRVWAGVIRKSRRCIRTAPGGHSTNPNIGLGELFRRKLLTERHILVLKPLLHELLPSLNAYLRSIVSRTETQSEGQS